MSGFVLSFAELDSNCARLPMRYNDCFKIMSCSNGQIKFYGACGTVTGSRFLVECNDDAVLIECGLFQGVRSIRQLNWNPFPYPLPKVKNIVVTHAHIDHTGYLPRLVRNGFKGKIHCTSATKDLLHIMLPDSAMIQEEDAAYYNRKRLSRHTHALPLYNTLDARRTLSKLIDHKPSKEYQISNNFKIEHKVIGHILGASMILLTVGHGDNRKRILFSGDIGRYGVPVIKDPQSPPDADILVIESTYGDRLHDMEESPRSLLAKVVNRVHDNKGVLLLPSFAVGRTQEILYDLRVLQKKKEIPRMPIYLDSPMAINVTELYLRHPEHFNHRLTDYIDKYEDFLSPENFQMVRKPADSKKLNSREGPIIIISASGMLTGGRIRHHLYHRISDPATELLFVGYQARGTRGRNLQDGAKTIHIFKQELAVEARVSTIHGYSAHADYNEMLRWMSEFKNPPKTVYIVHGEDDVRPVFADKIRQKFKDSEVVVPELKESFEV